MIRTNFIIYQNDNGVDIHKIDDDTDLAEAYQKLLEEHDDEYEFTSAYLISIDGLLVNSAQIYVQEIFIPELE